MADEIAKTQSGRDAMAWVGDTPWHGKGQKLEEGASIETWAEASGMDFKINTSPVLYTGPQGEKGGYFEMKDKVVLNRSDTGTGLAVVSNKYKVVQPTEVLEFYRNLVDGMGFKLETAGVLFGGKKYWALASIGEEAVIMNDDKIKGYLLLATACDGSMATTAQYESVRVVCNNTLQMALGARSAGAVKINHRTNFDFKSVQNQLGIADLTWNGFIDNVNIMANIHLAEKEADKIIAGSFGADMSNADEVLALLEHNRSAQAILKLYSGAGMGAKLASADGTAWGLMNAVTQFYDWERTSKTTDARIDKAWFGDGAAAKARTWNIIENLYA